VQKRAYLIADNKLAEQAGWDREILAIELGELIDLCGLGRLSGNGAADDCNLVLLRASENSMLKSAGFDVKKPIYQQSPYVLTAQIAQAETWTIKEITERQEVLANYALRAWPEKWK
jgi:hypothetical protein